MRTLRRFLTELSVLGCSAILALSVPSYAVTAEQAFERAKGGGVLIEVTDSGLEQSEYRMKVRQGMLFLLNNTTDSLLTFEFNFGKEGPSCYTSITPNAKFEDNGRLVSTRPIEPGNFASSCLAYVGDFDFTIFGLPKFPQGLKGKLRVTYE